MIVREADLYEREKRRNAYLRDMSWFSDRLYRIESVIPLGYLLNTETKEMTRVVPPEWQKKIDRILYEATVFTQTYYPEFMTEIKEGVSVTYTSPHGTKENGVVKSVDGNTAFVVYNCNGEWHNYKEYTGCATNIKNLKIGWDK